MEMREILFRGKRVDNGEWISGSILSFDDGGKVILSSTAKVFKEHGTTTICCNECYDVYPETVGQYTGLTDKNGVKIFEGDIVKEYKSKDKVKGVVKFGEYQSGINKYADDLGFYVEWTTENFLIQELGYWCRKNMLEVIGNVHDNPELLEGSNK